MIKASQLIQPRQQPRPNLTRNPLESVPAWEDGKIWHDPTTAAPILTKLLDSGWSRSNLYKRLNDFEEGFHWIKIRGRIKINIRRILQTYGGDPG